MAVRGLWSVHVAFFNAGLSRGVARDRRNRKIVHEGGLDKYLLVGGALNTI